MRNGQSRWDVYGLKPDASNLDIYNWNVEHCNHENILPFQRDGFIYIARRAYRDDGRIQIEAQNGGTFDTNGIKLTASQNLKQTYSSFTLLSLISGLTFTYVDQKAFDDAVIRDVVPSYKNIEAELWQLEIYPIIRNLPLFHWILS